MPSTPGDRAAQQDHLRRRQVPLERHHRSRTSDRMHPYQGSPPGLVFSESHLPPARTTYRWRLLDTVANRSTPMGCGPNVDQAALRRSSCGLRRCLERLALVEEVLVHFLEDKGVLDPDPTIVLHHQLGQFGSVDEHNAGVDPFCIVRASALKLLVVMKMPRDAWAPWSAPTYP